VHRRLLILLLLLAACAKAPPQIPQRPASAVQVAVSTKATVPLYLDEVGKCVARESVSIQPQVSGRITEIHFEDGADVAKGDLLFSIDARVYQAKLDAAEANLAAAKAARDLAKQEVSRVESLTEPRAISQAEKDQRKAALDTAEATVLQTEAAARSARIDVDYCSIRSPIDGRTGRRLVDVGNIVAPAFGPGAGTTLLVVQKIDPVYAEFTIPENELTSVQKHMSEGTLEVEVRLPDSQGPNGSNEPGANAPGSGADEARSGELSFLDNTVQSASGTVRLRASIPNQDHRFWPGRFVRVRLVLERIPEAVLVPASATQLSAQGPYVYVVKEDSTAELRPIVPGQRQGDLVVIQKGLQAGEKVVTVGHVGVMPGGPVRIVEPGAAPGAQSGAPAGSSGSAPKEASSSPESAPAKAKTASSGS
jgi:multidrug efflux system membrane fusion protein